MIRVTFTAAWIAFALAAVAGSVDGIGYLLLAHLFTSHMSGNTVAMTVHVAAGDWNGAWRRFEPIVAFFFGVVFGVGLTDVLTRVHFSRAFAVVAASEILLLLAFFALARPPVHWMSICPAGAMGMQNALLRRVGTHRVRTTFVSGMLTNTAHGLVDFIIMAVARDDCRGEKLRDFAFYGGIWLCFAVGGIAGAVLEIAHGTPALLLPIAGLVVLASYDVLHPVVTGEK